jgi:hypothetical protein
VFGVTFDQACAKLAEHRCIKARVSER